jgi:hypothetical protein
MEDPKTLKEWILYVSQISDEDLIVQAKYAGTQVFINMLTEDGYSSDDIFKIHKAFALRFQEDGRRIPMYDGILVDYKSILNPTSLPDDAT